MHTPFDFAAKNIYNLFVIAYDETKRAANLAKHGLDLAIAGEVLAGFTITQEDARESYGETRLKTLGVYRGVVVTRRATTLTISSASERQTAMKNATTGNITPADATDIARVLAMTDADIQFDEDNPRTTPEEWEGAVMKIGNTVIGHTPRRRGSGKKPARVAIQLRLPPDVLAAFRATGKGWQTRMSDVLREWLKSQRAA